MLLILPFLEIIITQKFSIFFTITHKQCVTINQRALYGNVKKLQIFFLVFLKFYVL